MRITQGSHAYAVSPKLYGYFQSPPSAAAAPTLRVVPSAAVRSDLRRKRVLGCQTYRRNRAVQMTEKTPETTSVMRCVGGHPEANHCMSAKERPAHSAAGQTSNASFQDPPSILTKVTTSQKGTSTETNGSGRRAIAAAASEA